MRRADHIIDLGPGAGMHGGEVVVQGTLRDIERHASSETGRCLKNPLCHPTRKTRRSLGEVEQWIEIRGAHAHNLKNVDARFPVGRLSVITGNLWLWKIDADAFGLTSGGERKPG